MLGVTLASHTRVMMGLAAGVGGVALVVRLGMC